MTNLKKQKKKVIIQPHNFPDPDALASAVALQTLMEKYSVSCQVKYFGTYQRALNIKLIRDFELDLEKVILSRELKGEESSREQYVVIAVDGNPENSNFIHLPYQYIGFFDHHIPLAKREPEEFFFTETLSDYGATSTILYQYLNHFKIKVNSDLATLLSIGLYTDTYGLTRKTSMKDIRVFNSLYKILDQKKFTYFSENSLEKRDIPYLQSALQNIKIEKHQVKTYIENLLNPSLLGILADILLKIIEINFVIILGFNNKEIYFSTRSENPDYSCLDYIQTHFGDEVFFGGHAEMAGGKFKKEFSDWDLVRQKVF